MQLGRHVAPDSESKPTPCQAHGDAMAPSRGSRAECCSVCVWALADACVVPGFHSVQPRLSVHGAWEMDSLD